MKHLLIFFFSCMVLQIGLSQNKCKYPKGLDVQFSLPSGNILTASDAKFKVSISNHDKKSVYVYDTLIDGDLFGFDSNFWIELRIQDSGKQWKEIRTYYGSNIPEGDSYQSQLTKSDLSSNETKVLYFDLFPNYVKYLKAGFYVAKIGIRKIPRSRKKDCGEYYLSKEIFFEVINEIR